MRVSIEEQKRVSINEEVEFKFNEAVTQTAKPEFSFYVPVKPHR